MLSTNEKRKTMANFQSETRNLGVVQRGRLYDISFRKTPECKKIIKTTAGCGCTQVIETKETIDLKWQVSHDEGMYAIKTVEVNYFDGTQDLLSFSAEITP